MLPAKFHPFTSLNSKAEAIVLVSSMLLLFFSEASLAKDSASQNSSLLLADKIIPAHPDAKGGGNPLQGLGRPDDPEPSRVEEHLKSLQKDASSKDNQSTNTGIKPKTKQPEKKSSAKASTKNDTIINRAKKLLNPVKKKQDKDILEQASSTLPIESARQSTNQNSFVPAVLSKPNNDNSPHRKALSLIQKRQYASAQTLLDDLVQKNKNDLKARYLLAVTLVVNGNNQSAINEYNYIIKNSKDPQLTRLAEFGLEKIQHRRNSVKP